MLQIHQQLIWPPFFRGLLSATCAPINLSTMSLIRSGRVPRYYRDEPSVYADRCFYELSDLITTSCFAE
jgi:hypothetical protein